MRKTKKNKNMNYLILALSIISLVIIINVSCSIKSTKIFPEFNIDINHLLEENETNLKDFKLTDNKSLIAESDDPWVYYTLPEPLNVKTVTIMVDSVSLQNTWAQLHFIMENGSWESQSFYVHDGINTISINNRQGFQNVSDIRFDFVNIKNISINVNNIIINKQFTISLEYHIVSLIIILSILLFTILPRANKKLHNFIRSYLCFFSFIICTAADFSILSYFFKILAIGMFGLFLFENNDKFVVKFEKMAMLLFGILLSVMMLMRGKTSGQYETLNVFCACSFVVIAIAYLLQNCNKTYILKWIAKNKIVLFIILCFMLLSVEVIDAWYMWDAWQYYTSLINVVEHFNADFSGVYELYLCGHASLGYSLWLILFQLFKEGAASAQIANIVLAGISIYAYFQILKKILGKKYSDKILALATMIYAFSPFILGIIGNLNLDSATLYFAVIFIACSLYHFECLELFFAFFFCFTKEPAIIYYVTYIIAKIVCEFLSDNKFSLKGLVLFGFGTIKNYLYALPAILWIILSSLKTNGGWGGSQASQWNEKGYNCFGISANIISMKLKQVFLLNYNWIFWALIVIGIIILIKQKRKLDKMILLKTIPIAALGIMVVLFECMYVTWTHARYIAPMVFTLYLITTIIIVNLKLKEYHLEIWNIILAILMLTQCFYTMDPVTRRVFREIPIGNTSICSLQLKPNERISDWVDFHDSVVYNRQYIYWQEILTDVFIKAEYDNNMLVVTPDDINSLKYSILGVNLDNKILWDSQNNKFEYYTQTADCMKKLIEVKHCNTTEAKNILKSGDYRRLLYIVPEWTTLDENFISDNENISKNIITQEKNMYKGYEVQYIIWEIQQ